MEPYTERVIKIIKNIPEGKVMTYGQIARLAGSPRGARQVVRVLHSLSAKYNLPWHRVINAKGELTIKDYDLRSLQKLHLQDEGVEFLNEYSINLSKCQWRKY